MEEKILKPVKGERFSLLHLIVLVVSVWSFRLEGLEPLAVTLFLVFIVCFRGYFSVLPGNAKLLFQWGSYMGTAKEVGFYWHVPWSVQKQFSLREQVTTTPLFQLVDKEQRAILWQAHIGWKVTDTAKAAFLSGSFGKQIEASVFPLFRSLAMSYSLKSNNPKEVSLQTHLPALQKALEKEANKALKPYGLTITAIGTSQLIAAPQRSHSGASSFEALISQVQTLLQAYQKSALPSLTESEAKAFVHQWLISHS